MHVLVSFLSLSLLLSHTHTHICMHIHTHIWTISLKQTKTNKFEILSQLHIQGCLKPQMKQHKTVTNKTFQQDGLGSQTWQPNKTALSPTQNTVQQDSLQSQTGCIPHTEHSDCFKHTHTHACTLTHTHVHKFHRDLERSRALGNETSIHVFIPC